MKFRTHVLAAIGLSVAGLAHGSPVFLDQQHAPEGNFGSLAVGNDRTQAQTFSVGITGLLTRIDVGVSRGPETVDDLVLGVWSTDTEGLPDEELATASVPASAVVLTSNRVFVSFELGAAGVFVTAGSRLAITLDSAADNTEPFQERWAWFQGGFYSPGRTFTLVSGTVVAGYGEDAHFKTFVELATDVTIDIQPRNDHNTVNPRSGGTLQVAIPTNTVFDATTVDTATVRFGPNGTEAPAVRADLVDVNGDKRPDLLLRFAIQATGIQCGQISASLSARTLLGELVLGTDALRTVGCPPTQ
jgi:hypothetical protein